MVNDGKETERVNSSICIETSIVTISRGSDVDIASHLEVTGSNSKISVILIVVGDVHLVLLSVNGDGGVLSNIDKLRIFHRDNSAVGIRAINGWTFHCSQSC